jgi:phosphate-selective porin
MISKRLQTTATLLLVVAFSTVRAQKIADYLSLSGFIDTQYDIESYNEKGTDISTLQVRRARLDIKGDLSERLSFRLQADFTSPKLVDAFIKYRFNKYINLQVGQFKTPFTLENPYSPLNLESIENAQAITKLAGYKDVSGVSTFANGRDVGVQISGGAFQKDEKWDVLTYYAGVFNGNGINTKDNNTDKDLIARIELRPIVEELVLSGSIYDGNYAINGKNADRNRYSAGLEYKNDKLTIRSEYLNGETEVSDGTDINSLNSNGFYAVAGYWFNFTGNGLSQKIRPVVRYDFFDNNSNLDNDEYTAYMVGFDWWPEKNLRLCVNYTLKDQKKYENLGHSLSAMMSIKF